MQTTQSRYGLRFPVALLAFAWLAALLGCGSPQGILLVTATPVVAPAGGTFTSAQSVVLTDSTPYAVIFYTTDGSAPTTSSTIYAGPISVSSTEVVTAMAQAPNHVESPVVAASFIVNLATPPLQQAATPVISPGAGAFSSAQTITLSDGTTGATIYYTADGSTPTAASTAYSGPFVLSASAMVQAIAIAPGYSNSSVATASYTISIPLPVAATPVISPAGGSFTSAQTVSLTDVTSGAAIFYTVDGSTPTATSTAYSGPFVLSASAKVQAIAMAPGYTNSPVATASYTINIPPPLAATPVISPAGGSFTSAQTVSLTDLTPGATIFYTVDGSTPTAASTAYSGPFVLSASATVRALAVASGYTNSSVATATFTITIPPPAATPLISPAGGTFTSAQTVTLTDTTPGATIHYTVDGTTPTAASTLYTAPLTLSASATVQAVAVASGYTSSAVASASFTITPPAATPVLSPGSGTFPTTQTVTLTDSTPSSTIFYTVDGSTPTASSQVYTAPVSLTGTTTVKAVALAPGYTLSAVASATYTLVPITPAPLISPGSGSFTSFVSVSLSDSASSARIYYTLDGSAPTTSSRVYTAPLTLSTTTTVRAVAQVTGSTLSAGVSTTFTQISPGSGVTGTVAFRKSALQGATVSLYAVGQTGYGSAPSVISINPAITDLVGGFTVQYSCPSASSLVYAVALGSGSSPGLTLVTPLGPCGALLPANTVFVNELTSVASAWALAPFVQLLPGGFQIGTSSTNGTGLSNAFLTAQNLVDIAHGTIGGSALPTGATLPVAEMNTLADVLASYATSATALFQAATPAWGTAPTDLFSAAVDIARNPAHNVPALYALVTSTSPFQPALTAAPADWTLAVRYIGGGLDAPSSLAVDQAGAIWVANYFSSVSKFNAQGGAISLSTGYTGGGLKESYGLAVDGSGNVWVTNQQSASTVNAGNGSVTKLSSTGAVLSGTNGYTAGGINYPEAVAIDTAGNVWVANYGSSTGTLLSSSGNAISPSSGYGSGQMAFPVAVALDASNTAWFGNQGSSTITAVPQGGSPASEVTCCQGASGIAIDQQGNLWTANYYGNSVSEITSAGKVVSAGYTGGGLNGPRGIAVDGAETVWVVNFQGNSITQLQGANSANPGRAVSLGTAANLIQPYALAIDGTGSVWVTSFGNNSIVQFPGAATPVKTPLIALPQMP